MAPKSAASILTGSHAEAAAPEDAKGMEGLQLLEVKQKLSSTILEKVRTHEMQGLFRYNFRILGSIKCAHEFR